METKKSKSQSHSSKENKTHDMRSENARHEKRDENGRFTSSAKNSTSKTNSTKKSK